MNKINIDIHKQIVQLGLEQIYYFTNILSASKTEIEIKLSIAEQIKYSVQRNSQLQIRFKILGI